MKLAKEIFTEPVILNSFSINRVDKYLANSEVPSRLSYHRILLVESGIGELIIDSNPFEIKGHKVFLMSKGQVYKFEKTAIITGYNISFGDCFWEKTPQSASNCKAVLFNNATANQNLQLSRSEVNELSFLFNALLNEYRTPYYINQMDVFAAYLKVIMIKLANVKLTEGVPFYSEDYILYRRFMDLLSAQYHIYSAVNDYAEMLNITSRRLSELCKRCSGINAKEIINGQIIAEAKRSLQFSSYTIKEIAYALNFSSPEQFSHFFKKNTKLSPTDYRSQFISINSLLVKF